MGSVFPRPFPLSFCLGKIFRHLGNVEQSQQFFLSDNLCLRWVLCIFVAVDTTPHASGAACYTEGLRVECASRRGRVSLQVANAEVCGGRVSRFKIGE